MAEELHLVIKQLKIFDNEEWWGTGEFRIWSFVNSGQVNFLDLPAFRESSADERRALIREGVVSSVTQWAPLEFTELEDNHTITFGNTGRRIYTASPIPRYFDWVMFGIESDDDVRSIGGALSEFLTDERIDSTASLILTLSSIPATAVTQASTALAKLAVSGLASILQKNRDDTLFRIEQSFLLPEHYADGFYEDRNCPTVMGRAWYSFKILTYEY